MLELLQSNWGCPSKMFRPCEQGLGAEIHTLPPTLVTPHLTVPALTETPERQMGEEKALC